jgi:hypothetical protein
MFINMFVTSVIVILAMCAVGQVIYSIGTKKGK